MGKQRQRTRIKSRVDELPEEMRQLLDARLANVTISYQEIADELKAKGYEISKSSIGRYALRQGAVMNRLKEATEQTRMIIEAMKEDNGNIDAISAANKILTDELAKKFAIAQDEIANMPIDKAARIAVQLERSAVYKEKFKLEFTKGYKKALAEVKREMMKYFKSTPELYEKIAAIVNDIEKNIAQKLEGADNE